MQISSFADIDDNPEKIVINSKKADMEGEGEKEGEWNLEQITIYTGISVYTYTVYIYLYRCSFLSLVFTVNMQASKQFHISKNKLLKL